MAVGLLVGEKYPACDLGIIMRPLDDSTGPKAESADSEVVVCYCTPLIQLVVLDELL